MPAELATGVVTLTVSTQGMGRGIIEGLEDGISAGADKVGKKLGDRIDDGIDDVLKKPREPKLKKPKIPKPDAPELPDLPDWDPPKFFIPTDDIAKITRELERLGDRPIDLDVREDRIAVQRIQRQIDRLSDQAIDLDVDWSNQLGPLRAELERRLGDPLEVPVDVDADAGALGAGFSDGFLSGAAGLKAGIAGLLTGGVAAFFADGFSDAVGREANIDLQGARFDVPEEAMTRAGQAASAVYSDAFGDSVEENLSALLALEAAGVEIEGASQEQLARRIIDADAVGDFLGLEAAEVGQLFNSALSNEIARNTTDVSDAIIGRLSGLSEPAREEFPDFINEYSKFADQLGLTLDDITALIEAGGDNISTAMDLDRFGDLLKEGSLLIAEGGADIDAALAEIGLGADISARIAEGGPAAREALQEVFAGLGDVADAQQQRDLFVDLFGTPAEDFGADFDTSAFADALNLDPSQVAGSTNDFVERATGNTAYTWDDFWRGIEERKNTAFDNLLVGFQEDGVSGLFSAIVDEAGAIWDELEPELQEFLDEDLLPWWDNEAKPALEEKGTDLAVAAMKWLQTDAPPLAYKGTKAIAEAIGQGVADYLLGDEVLGRFTGAGEAFVDKIEAGADLAWEDTKDFFVDLPGEMVDAIGNVDDLLFGVGEDIIAGLKSGLESAIGGVTSWFGDQVDGLAGIAKEKLGINSPSRVFMGVGLDVGAGLQLGLEQSADPVHLAVADLTGNMAAYVQAPDVVAPVAAADAGPSVVIERMTVTENVRDELNRLVGAR